jgi:disulfide bond formation protein DsbB
MAKFTDLDEDPPAPVAAPESVGSTAAQMIARIAGLIIMTIGLWVSLAVIVEAWSLYRSPEGIETMARAIERGSHLDQSLARVSQDKTEPDESSPSARPKREKSESMLGFRLSYFVAWVISLLLLMLIGRLAIAAIKTGGELVLYDRHVQQLAREIVRESRRARG